MEQNLEILEKQLGRRPRNVVRIEKRCEAGYPQVVTTAPILDTGAEPGIFPTTYWLTCPQLNYRISQLEDQGWIKKLEKRVASDDQLAHQLQLAHKNYCQDRLALQSEEELKKLKQEFPGQYQMISSSGVGGIKGPGIKCLHTHYAHYLAADNPIGRLVAELLKSQYEALDPADCSYQCRLEGSK